MNKKISFVAMGYSFMKRIYLFLFAIMLMGLQAYSQLNHFIYLQTDNQQPFYIKYNNRIYSSSAAGYLILSKLSDGPVNFTVGFPKSDLPELQFQSVIEKVDIGYLIKNFGEKGWALYDLQNSTVTYTSVATGSKTNETIVSKNQQVVDDPFANMLSKITQDSTVKNVTVMKQEKPEKPVVDTPKLIVSPVNSVQQEVKDSLKTAITQQPILTTEAPATSDPEWVAPARSSVKQIRRFDSKEGSDFVFEIGEVEGQKDTIRLFIEKDTSAVSTSTLINSEIKPDTIQAVNEKVKIQVDTPVIKKEEPRNEEVKQPVVVEQKPIVKTLPNSNCKAIATEDDFIKLRRKMANESKEDEMVNEAKKVFKTKCFSTTQLKNLAVLFLKDEGRYRFYDAAMLYVTDFSNFKDLSETIQDEYYKKRFLALLPNQ